MMAETEDLPYGASILAWRQQAVRQYSAAVTLECGIKSRQHFSREGNAEHRDSIRKVGPETCRWVDSVAAAVHS